MCACDSTSTLSKGGLLAAVHVPPTYASTLPVSSFPTSEFGHLSWHTLISSPQTPSDSLSCGIGSCPPLTGSLALHRHAQAEIYHVLEGKGTVFVDGEKLSVEKGSTVFIPGDAEHGVENKGEEELKWFYVFPTGNFEDVKYRFS